MKDKNITFKISETNYKILRFILIVFIAYVVGYVFGQVYSHYTHR
jgi:TRAP-type C4-dicarboxylate transport system permease small subunit